MPTLHMVNKSPFEKRTLYQCLDRVRSDAGILLIEDAVYAATEGTCIATRMQEVARRYEVFVLEPDLTARGMQATKVIAGIACVDYAGFVKLVERFDRVLSWL